MLFKHKHWLSLVVLMLVTLGLTAKEKVQDKAQEKPVLCWYMVCYSQTVEDYMEEMALAKANGIDVFLLDISGHPYRPNKKTGKIEKTNYGFALERMFEAAKRLLKEGKDFKLALAPEAYIQRTGLSMNVKQLVNRFVDHPNYFHYKGKPLFISYIGRPGKWAEPLAELRKERNFDPLWIGFFGNSRWSMMWSPEIIEGFFKESEDLDGLISFGVHTTASEVSNNSNGRRVTQKLGKIYAAGVNPCYNSSNCIERRGLEGYEALWKGAINDGADMVGIVIWNDYNEDSNLFPGRWPFGDEKEYISRDESYLNATSHYAAWFKTGVKPEISQDKFFAIYRIRTKNQDRAWDADQQKWVRIRNKKYPYDQFHDDNEDGLYVSTFLTAPAEITVTIGDKTYTEKMPAGSYTMAVALSPGTPHFTLRRNGKVLADVVGGRKIIAEETKENSSIQTKGKHLLYRNYTYGTAIGPVSKSLHASKAKLLGNAEYASLKTSWLGGKTQGVETKPKNGSGFEIPVSGLKTGTYNIRITYSNPSENDARLTLTIDGMRTKGTEKAGKLRKRILPVYFAPTGKNKLATTSFMWSLFDTTSKLKLDYQLGKRFNKTYPAGDDKGSVFIEKIELIKVDPVVKPKVKDFSVPEMVNIPSGTFKMGSDKNEPDEQPVRKATLSPFAISKYEVTNEQFEQFMPDHKRFRDQYSWRDRDPVTYVKWLEAMEYCNWLSEKQGLEPAYKQETYKVVNEYQWRRIQILHKRAIAKLKKKGKSTDQLKLPKKPIKEKKRWVFDSKANGYRLPSEAQWEYVAAGRDENRTYVWGETAPNKESCHAALARGEKMNPSPTQVPAAGYLPGVVPVGSFPNDQTRDGVMDMSGNVAEWCNDWYDDYDPQDLKDPNQSKQSKTMYRAIRGGSWGVYNYSLRVADREYNTQVFGGFPYIGFRVVLPEKCVK